MGRGSKKAAVAAAPSGASKVAAVVAAASALTAITAACKPEDEGAEADTDEASEGEEVD